MKRIVTIIIIYTFLNVPKTFCQDYITWNPEFLSNFLTGTFPGGTVSVTQTNIGNDIQLFSPPLLGSAVIVQSPFTFSSFGPYISYPSKYLTFTFSTPVIITTYNMSDIDLGPNWNDTFNFVGVTFSSSTSVNCISTNTGAIATTDTDFNGEVASWFTSTTPVTSFSLNYIGDLTFTHAYLAYSMEVMLPTTTVPSVTVNSPTFCSNVSATVTATPNVVGTYNYVWTVPTGFANPGNVATFDTNFVGNYTVIITNTITNQSSAPSTGTVTAINAITPNFAIVNSICSGDLITLPSVSANGISGTWSPPINNLATTTYDFTPTAGLCANIFTKTIIVNPKITPDFLIINSICTGDLITLPTVSPNGISGTWLPPINNLATTTYNFTPTVGLCANNFTKTIVVNPKITPNFIFDTSVCYNSNILLPTISENSIMGTWSPLVNKIATTTYTFTPAINQCAIPVTKTIIVKDDFDFQILGNCVKNNFILSSKSINNTYDAEQVDYEWQLQSNTISNSANLDLTAYFVNNNLSIQLPLTVNLIITNVDNCIKSKSISIDNIYCAVQKGISPNNDNVNDFFDLRLLEVNNLSIYNRYGTLVYDKENYTREWIGETNAGNLLPDGVYYYLINFRNSQLDSKTGWIYINRQN